MTNVVNIKDRENLVPTKEYKYAKWGFEHFNPVQSGIFEVYEEDANALIAAKTSAGKTVIAEMFLAHEVRKRGGKGMFLAPMRALAQEKIDQWGEPEYHFGDLNISICTGDYRITDKRQEELDRSNIIVMTSEMLNHRARNINSEKSKYLHDIQTLVVDESHLLTVPDRGEHLEVGLMKFTKINPNCRIVLLSATMPNVSQIAEWMSESLNKKKTFVLNSEYRPVPLGIHYECYDDESSRYDICEKEKIDKAMDIINDYPDDKFLIFAHTKRTGEQMTNELQRQGVKAEFHNADLNKENRVILERKFRQDKDFRVVVATPTLAWGVNMPARRVIILGVHRGKDKVEVYNITQMVGRSGRLGIDPRGDAYVLLPASKSKEHMDRLNLPQNITSRLIDDPNKLAFHLVDEIYRKSILNESDVWLWYERSLASFQERNLSKLILRDLINDLIRKEIIYENEGTLEASSVAKVSSIFYCCPFDIASLRRNMYHLFNKKLETSDIHVAVALAKIERNRLGIVNTMERQEISHFDKKLQTTLKDEYRYLSDGMKKAAYCYLNLMDGKFSSVMSGYQRGLQSEFERMEQVLCALDSMSGKWGREIFFRELSGRIRYGVPSHLLGLCRIPNIGKVRAKKLYDMGYKTTLDVSLLDASKLKKILNMREDLVAAVINEALRLSAP